MGRNYVAAGLNWCTSQTLVGQGPDQTPDLEADQGHTPEAGHAPDHMGRGPALDHTGVGAGPTADPGQEVDHEAIPGQTASLAGVINNDQDRGLAQAPEIMFLKDQNLIPIQDHDHLLPKELDHLGRPLQELRSPDQNHDQDLDHLRKKDQDLDHL